MKISAVLQHDEEDCGAACMAMIAGYYGLKLPLAKFRNLMCFSNNGTSVYDIVQVAESLNFNAMPLKGNFENLLESIQKKEVHLPCIVLVKSEVFFHFIVVYKVTSKLIYYIDPAEGYCKISHRQFASVYENVIIELQPNELFIKQKHSSNTGKIIKKCLNQNRKGIIFLFVNSVLITFLGIVASIVVATAMGYLVESQENSLKSVDILKNVYDIKFIIILCLIFCAKLVVELIQNVIFSFAASRIEADMLRNFYDKLLITPLDTIKRRKSGELIARFTDIRKFNNYIIHTLTSGISNIVFLMGFGIVLFVVSPTLLFVLLIVGVSLFIVTSMFHGKIKKRSLDVLNNNAKIVDDIEQSLCGIELIKGLALEEKKKENFFCDLKKYSESLRKFMVMGSSHNSIIEFLSEVGNYIVLCLGTILCINGKIQIDHLILFYLVFTYFMSSLSRLVYLQPEIAEIKTIFSRMEDIGECENESVGDFKNNIDVITSIQADNITYGYTPWKKIIENLSFEINEGEKILLTGPNGGGKSTLAHLISADYQVQTGEIKYNGISEVNRESIKNNITYVNQEVYLFHDSLYNNLVFGCTNVEYEKMMQVCELTGVREIIESFTEGLAHILSAGGKDLSGGQRQKIALARALMRDTPVYIFDESSSNMDSDSEEMFINLINEYLSKKTVIIISHREKFKNYVDKVYHVEGGKLC
ncbi:MAG: peptidase domain-containing ABC transporter [Lachnospiraceae bacterium]|nr:peptidase domain-containing ABC transporter [Lachnospiraceae bacterium]